MGCVCKYLHIPSYLIRTPTPKLLASTTIILLSKFSLSLRLHVFARLKPSSCSGGKSKPTLCLNVGQARIYMSLKYLVARAVAVLCTNRILTVMCAARLHSSFAPMRKGGRHVGQLPTCAYVSAFPRRWVLGIQVVAVGMLWDRHVDADREHVSWYVLERMPNSRILIR